MGDSEDEYDRKRRDKFRGERTESYRGEGREGRREERRAAVGSSSASREEWMESAPPARKVDKGYPEYDPYEAKKLRDRANSFQYQSNRGSDSWAGGRNRQQSNYEYRAVPGPGPGRNVGGASGGSRERYSPPGRSHEVTQPIKRSRTDWGDDRRYMPETSYGGGGGGGGGGGYHGNNPWGPPETFNPHPGPYVGHGNNARDLDPGQTQPAMMSFKAFLQTQDDNISDDDAIRKYNEYKLEFKRQQLNDFFVNHKDEEWFKIKYHPEDAVKRRDEQMAALKNRVSVFLEFLEKDRFLTVSVDADQSELLVKLLDAVVIRLEGGSEFDLKVLEEVVAAVHQYETRQEEPTVEKSSFTPPRRSTEEKEEEKTTEEGEEGEEDEAKECSASPLNKKDADVAEEEEDDEEDDDKKEKEKSPEKEEPKKEDPEPSVESSVVGMGGKKRKREYDFESGSDSADDMDDAPMPRREIIKEPSPPGFEVEQPSATSVETSKPKENGNGTGEANEEGEDDDDDDDSKPGKTETEEPMEEGKEEEDSASKPESKARGEEEDEEEVVPKVDEKPKPRALHKTASIFLRNLAPTITKQEVEAMCKRYPGFLRVAIADPQPERRWFRRGWVTFERNVNIKEICWNLNNIRLRDCELGAIVNRDLSRRIRTVNGITSHKQVVRHDIKLAARIVQNLDSKSGLWVETGNSKQAAQSSIPSFGMVSKNPVLKNITDYLIEEASAEEEELLGQTASVDGDLGNGEGSECGGSGGSGVCSTVERDESLLKVLDRLLFYLRVVHSVDYYNHCEYPNEDEMPNRCGIMHARGIPPSSKVTQQEISDYCHTFEQKIASFLQPSSKLTEEEYSKLGAKDPNAEVEKFVVANTQELAKDKWLCPLSGKKFKGAEFVKKHIFNKHGEKVDEVKKEVEYFNNYLRDPKRPQLPEHPGNRPQKRDGPGERDGFGGPGYMPHYGGYNYGGGMGNRHGYNNYGGGGGGAGGSFGGPGGYNREPYHRESFSRPPRGHFNNRGNRGDYRPVIHYRDLDAPHEPEEF